jgi:hypothetical protein
MVAVLVPHEYVGGTALSADAPSTRTVVKHFSRSSPFFSSKQNFVSVKHGCVAGWEVTFFWKAVASTLGKVGTSNDCMFPCRIQCTDTADQGYPTHHHALSSFYFGQPASHSKIRRRP